MYIYRYILRPSFEWDEVKREANLAKHGLDFVVAQAAFDGPMLVGVDDRRDYGEVRYRGIGGVRRRVVVVVWTVRGNCVRIISARRANVKETSRFQEFVRQAEQGAGARGPRLVD